jgi:hypothetical protein
MDPHNLPGNANLHSLDPAFSNTGPDGSLLGSAENKPDQYTQTMDSSWTTPIEAVSEIEHTTLATDDHIPSLYDTYRASYMEPVSKISAHMQHAKALALAMLQRHYPESQNYRVELASLGPLSAKGINFIMKENNEPDSDPDTPPPKKKRTAKTTNTHYSYEAPWHWIEPESMAAFVVKQRFPGLDMGAEAYTYRTHTCLVIIIDDLSTFHRWSRANVNHRGDVLSDLLGVKGDVEKGHGALFFGPRLELYDFAAQNDDTPVTPYQNQSWKLDMRTTSLTTVDEVLGDFARQEVVRRTEL